MKTKIVRWLAAAAALVFLAAILARRMRGTPGNQRAHQAKPAATSPQVKVTHQNGRVVVHLDQQTLARLGIAESPLKPTRERKQLEFPATVLPVENLQSLVSAYDAASARLRKAEIAVSVSQKEYERLKKLYDDQQNVSAKACRRLPAFTAVMKLTSGSRARTFLLRGLPFAKAGVRLSQGGWPTTTTGLGACSAATTCWWR